MSDNFVLYQALDRLTQKCRVLLYFSLEFDMIYV